MLYKSSFLSRCAILALALPIAGFSAVNNVGITVSTTDAGPPAGSTPTAVGYGTNNAATLAANALGFGGTNSGSYSFNVTAADGDMYNVAGTFNNTFLSGTFLGFFPTVTYEGNSTPGHPTAISADTITLNMLQDFTYPGSSISWAGNYNEDLPLVLPVAGSSASGQVLYSTVTSNGVTVDAGGTVGSLGPVFGTAVYDLKGTNNISPLDGNYLASDFQFVFTFPGGTGTSVGGFISSPASLVPEPAQTIPTALGLAGLLLFGVRKLRFGNSKQ
jgi:hypothetical protein